jgi:hypothetical protein
MMNLKPTGTEIRAYRNAHSCGFHEAREILMGEWRKKKLYKIRLRASELYTIEALREVVVDLVDFLMDETT